MQGLRPPEPFVLRLNTLECAEYWHTNLVPHVYELDDYQVRTPTDIIGQHIHLVKFDVTSSDGSGNGFNYEGAQLSAYSSSLILIEGLKRSGRDLSREKLIINLERLYEFDTGFTPLITYGPNRHIGALGAYIVTVDPPKAGREDFIASKEWVVLTETEKWKK